VFFGRKQVANGYGWPPGGALGLGAEWEKRLDAYFEKFGGRIEARLRGLSTSRRAQYVDLG